MKNFSIPLQIDNINLDPVYDRARCVYYRIEVLEGFVLHRTRFLSGNNALFATEVRWAALAGPDQGNQEEIRIFDSPELITNTFKGIHESNKLLMELGYIWVPNKMLRKNSQNEDLSVGSIYRISRPYFIHCYRFTTERISAEEWLNPKTKFKRPIVASPQETKAFRQWRKDQIQISSEIYHRPENAYLHLAKKEANK